MSEIITLKHPVTLGDGTILEKVTLRRPTVGDVIAAGVKPGTQDIAGETKLIARLCGLVIDDLHLLDLSDYMSLQAGLARFLADAEI
jgi:hypothetical protein